MQLVGCFGGSAKKELCIMDFFCWGLLMYGAFNACTCVVIVSCPDRRSGLPRSDGLAREVEFLGFMGGATGTLIEY